MAGHSLPQSAVNTFDWATVGVMMEVLSRVSLKLRKKTRLDFSDNRDARKDPCLGGEDQ